MSADVTGGVGLVAAVSGCDAVASAVTYRPAPGHGLVVDHITVPLLHDRIGRTLHADIRGW